MSRTTLLHVSALHPNPSNIRKVGDVVELAESMKVHGVLQALEVAPHPTRTGHYVIVFGHRRHQAAQLARVEIVPCVIRRDALTPADVRALQIVENFHREDMTAIEKAEAVGGLAKTHNRATIARMTGLAPSTVSRYLALPDLDEASRERVRAGIVGVGDALAAVRALGCAAGHAAPATTSADPRPSKDGT